jgi:hypothetical protein
MRRPIVLMLALALALALSACSGGIRTEPTTSTLPAGAVATTAPVPSEEGEPVERIPGPTTTIPAGGGGATTTTGPLGPTTTTGG